MVDLPSNNPVHLRCIFLFSHPRRDSHSMPFSTLNGSEAHSMQIYLEHCAQTSVTILGGIQGYTKFSPIHLGAHGGVYQAVDCATNRVVAIKIVSSDPDRASPNKYRALDNDLTKDFSILQSINHPHVLEILSVYRNDADRMTSIVLEFMPRGTLLDYMLEEYNRQNADDVLRPPGIEEIPARDIMYQLCQAMSYVHGLGIVHRNLKAENIFLTGDTLPFIKIGGFGLAVRSEGQKLTEVSGSFDYMAPELLSPAKPGYDHRADSWSAGILLFTLLILSTPWIFGATADEKHLFTLRWEVLGDRLSDEGYDFLRGLLSVEPEQRPSLANALSHRWLAYHRPMYPNVIYPPASEIFVQSAR
ncbi:kinase-like domain-containing protein [Mycena galericulata]|nr:kinase-like domain-containing protein [Mycena galericulata]